MFNRFDLLLTVLGHAIIKPVVAKILEIVLKLIRETVNDDLNGVIQRLISTFEDDIAQYAVNIAHHLAETFKVVLERDDDENIENRAMTAMGLLNTIESMVNVLEDNKPIMQQLEPIVLSIVGYVLQNNSQGIHYSLFKVKTGKGQKRNVNCKRFRSLGSSLDNLKIL